jgi:hypothetical protein
MADRENRPRLLGTEEIAVVRYAGCDATHVATNGHGLPVLYTDTDTAAVLRPSSHSAAAANALSLHWSNLLHDAQ